MVDVLAIAFGLAFSAHIDLTLGSADLKVGRKINKEEGVLCS
jgi:hypothetical protein